MFFRLFAPLACGFLLGATPLVAQQNAAPPADLYAQIPVLGESGEQKLQSGDTRGAIEDFRKAFEGSRTLSQQYPQEPAYRENAYYYLGRLASAFGALNDVASGLQMAEPSARGYTEIVAADPSAENKEKAAGALNRLAWFQILSNNGAAAEASARQALTHAPAEPMINVNLAHALLLKGKTQEARTLYNAAKSQPAGDGRSMREVILEDFDAMQKAGIAAATIAPMRTALGGSATAVRSGSSRARGGSALPTWLFISLIAIGIAGIFAIFIYFDRKRTAALEARARTLGFTFRRKATAEDRQLTAGSNLTTLGRSRHVRNVIELPELEGARMTLFDFSYVIGSGKRNRTYQQTVTRVQSPRLNLPAFDMRPESVLFKIAQSLGMKDIDIAEAPTFSRMYMLRGQDEAAIRRLFTPELLRFCEGSRGFWISGAGNLLWFHRENRRVKADELDTFVNAARQTLALFMTAQSAGGATPPPPPPMPPQAPPPLPPAAPPPLPTA